MYKEASDYEWKCYDGYNRNCKTHSEANLESAANRTSQLFKALTECRKYEQEQADVLVKQFEK